MSFKKLFFYGIIGMLVIAAIIALIIALL